MTHLREREMGFEFWFFGLVWLVWFYVQTGNEETGGGRVVCFCVFFFCDFVCVSVLGLR